MTLRAAHETIETERLILRRITPDDAPFYARIHADPEVARYISHGRPRTPAETQAFIESVLASYATLSLGQLAIVRRSDGELLGRCGLSHLESEVTPATDGIPPAYYYPARAPAGTVTRVELELGYTLDRAAWRQGYATEAVAAVWKYARENRPGERVVSLIHPDNHPSQKLANRFGVSLVDRLMFFDRPFDRYAWPSGNSPSTDR
jgi:ribosomal-protein-alanine N-acetyltransferase